MSPLNMPQAEYEAVLGRKLLQDDVGVATMPEDPPTRPVRPAPIAVPAAGEAPPTLTKISSHRELNALAPAILKSSNRRVIRRKGDQCHALCRHRLAAIAVTRIASVFVARQMMVCAATTTVAGSATTMMAGEIARRARSQEGAEPRPESGSDGRARQKPPARGL